MEGSLRIGFIDIYIPNYIAPPKQLWDFEVSFNNNFKEGTTMLQFIFKESMYFLFASAYYSSSARSRGYPNRWNLIPPEHSNLNCP